MREEFSDKAAFGIIDDDKIVQNFKDFSLILRHNKNLTLYKHQNKPHYIVKIGKAAENFILENAEKCNFVLADYNLPSDLAGLRKITKSTKSLQNNELKCLFNDIKQNENSDFKVLAEWIEKFKENPYSTVFQ
jgi:hypothetical protein